jgi:glycosyltransferase involved in cell wall biosynthesis
LVTEEPFRQNSFGFGRTMTNLFGTISVNELMLYVKDGDFTHKDYQHTHSYISFDSHSLTCTKPRWYAPYLNLLYFPINHSYLYLRRNTKNVVAIKQFNPDVVVIVPMDYTTLLEGYLLANKIGKPYVVFLMDDSMRLRHFHVGGTTLLMTKRIMRKATGWMMISEYLENTLVTRYAHRPKFSLIAHNPVYESMIQPARSHIKKRSTFKIMYAGSVHAFHADALIYFAQAVNTLCKNHFDIELHIYCQDFAWATYKSSLDIEGVYYGGVIPYDQLFVELNKADLLLCTTSFDLTHKHLVETSVFTKITDYMASAVPVLSYGPDYSANSQYLRKHGIGLVFADRNIGAIVDFIEAFIFSEADEKSKIVERQLDFINKYHEVGVVQRQIWNFLRSIKEAA